MRQILRALGSLATKVESWWALGLLVMSTGGFAWLGQQWGALAAQGWPAIIFVALLAASILTSALALAYLAFHALRGRSVELTPVSAQPLSSSDAFRATVTVSDPPPFSENGLYVGTMTVSTGKLQDEGWVEITARCFNATGHAVFVHRAQGAIKVGEIVGSSGRGLGELPPPHLVHNANNDKVQDWKEFIISIEQRVPREMAERILSATDDHSVSLDLDSLTVTVCSHNAASASARLPVWNGIRLTRSPDKIASGQIVSAYVGAAGKMKLS